MKKILKRKFIASLITIFNIGFLFLLANPSHTDGMEGNLLMSAFQALTLIISISIMYVAPIIIIIGLPVSISVDFLTQNTKYKNIISFILHIAFGILVMLILSFVFLEPFKIEKLLNTDTFIYYNFLFIYPTIVFWVIDSLLKREKN